MVGMRVDLFRSWPLVLGGCLVREPAPVPPPSPMPHQTPAHTNRLAAATSPYLLQHAHNPVDWYPWGPEALERARREERPIFLSIGYSACHWCHVMERESFEDAAIAALLNRHFVCIKVDREERPDLDEIYMKAVQAMTGAGGWPMSVFLTPDLEPFFGGTYFPPERRYGRPGFPEIVEAIAAAWERDRASVVQRGKALSEMIRRESAASTAGDLDPGVLDASLAALRDNFDAVWGGFGAAPKFPHSIDVRLLLRHHLRTHDESVLAMARRTLDRMASGGMYDQLGGGFHRYSTDEKWLIPHFEKMLYDNALLVPAYLEAFLATGDPEYARVARECCEWALREMVTPEGAFASSQDADSEGEEGRFFVWTRAELERALGPRIGAWAAAWYGVTEEGNFEHGKSVLWRPDPASEVAERLGIAQGELIVAMQAARKTLFEARAKRVQPATDDKVLASWNGLMISALAQCYQVLGDARHLAAARRAADYVLERMRREDGALLATARGGRAHLDAYLDDYAFVIQALIDLYESDFDPRRLREARALERVVAERFEDPERGGFFTTASDHEVLLARLKSPQDGALPSGASVLALDLLRLAELTGDRELAQRAERTIRSMGAIANRYPSAFGQLMIAVDFIAAQPREIAIVGHWDDPEARAMLETVRGRWLPQRVVALAAPGEAAELGALFEGRTSPDGRPRAWVCRNYACLAPVDSAEQLALALDR